MAKRVNRGTRREHPSLAPQRSAGDRLVLLREVIKPQRRAKRSRWQQPIGVGWPYLSSNAEVFSIPNWTFELWWRHTGHHPVSHRMGSCEPAFSMVWAAWTKTIPPKGPGEWRASGLALHGAAVRDSFRRLRSGEGLGRHDESRGGNYISRGGLNCRELRKPRTLPSSIARIYTNPGGPLPSLFRCPRRPRRSPR